MPIFIVTLAYSLFANTFVVDSVSAVVIKGSGNMNSKAAYQIPIGLQWFFSVFILCGLPFCPESPWVLVRQGKVDQAQTFSPSIVQ